MSLPAALALAVLQDVNDVRSAAEFLPAECDVFISIPDAPAARRKLRKEPYKTLMADLAKAMAWDLDPSRLLGLLGGELALVIPDVQKDAVIVIIDTGVKNNS